VLALGYQVSGYAIEAHLTGGHDNQSIRGFGFID
jgi:hypothetical protein